jgi:hypothetical protein
VIKLTGFYKYSGHVAAMREYLRLISVVADTYPEELDDKMSKDLSSFKDELDEVSEKVALIIIKR